MRNIIKLFLKIVLIIFIIGIITMSIDFIRVNSNKLPVFTINSYNSKNKKETYTGIFHTFERKIKTSLNENLSDSKNQVFKILFIKIKINKKQEINEKDLNIEIVKEEECTNSKLLDFNYESNLYSYCIEDIKINNVKATVSSIKKIESKLKYLGFTSNSEIYGIDDLVVYKCTNELDDYYITSNDTAMGNDLCVRREIEKRRIK